MDAPFIDAEARVRSLDPEGRLLAKATGTAVPTPFKSYKS